MKDLVVTVKPAGKPGKNFTKFTTGDWTAGQVNATVYVPNGEAASVKAVTVRITRSTA